MRAIVDAPQPASIHVAVDLGGRERRVAEELLDHAQVGASLEQVRRERVAQTVRVPEEPAQRARVETPAARRKEEGVRRPASQLSRLDLPTLGRPTMTTCGTDMAKRDAAK